MNISIFDVLGPVMIGPSSSHTAGTARLARVAAQIVGVPFNRVEFALSGSLAHTWRGHGSDRALVAGALGMRQDDERLSQSHELAARAGLAWNIIPIELPDAPDNTARITFYEGARVLGVVVGAFTGGGRIRILQIDDTNVDFTAESPTLVVRHRDAPGVISAITSKVSQEGVNIALMRVNRDHRGGVATAVIETDQPIPRKIIKSIGALDHVEAVRIINL